MHISFTCIHKTVLSRSQIQPANLVLIFCVRWMKRSRLFVSIICYLPIFCLEFSLFPGIALALPPQSKIPGTVCMRMYEPMILLSATYGRLPSVSFGYPGSRILTKQHINDASGASGFSSAFSPPHIRRPVGNRGSP